MCKIVCKKASQKQALFVILFIVSLSQAVSAQYYKTKTLPKPKFYIIGVTEKNFPTFKGTWSDSLKFTEYGTSIMNWIISNPEKWNSIIQSKNEYTQFNYLDFEKLDGNQKEIFDQLSNQLVNPLKAQKENLVQIFNEKNPEVKTNDHLDFINNSEQVYLLNSKEVNYLKSKLIH